MISRATSSVMSLDRGVLSSFVMIVFFSALTPVHVLVQVTRVWMVKAGGEKGGEAKDHLRYEDDSDWLLL